MLKETVAIQGFDPPPVLVDPVNRSVHFNGRAEAARARVLQVRYVHASAAVDNQRRYVMGVLGVEIDVLL